MQMDYQRYFVLLANLVILAGTWKLRRYEHMD
jgi:hypothetical protein